MHGPKLPNCRQSSRDSEFRLRRLLELWNVNESENQFQCRSCLRRFIIANVALTGLLGVIQNRKVHPLFPLARRIELTTVRVASDNIRKYNSIVAYE